MFVEVFWQQEKLPKLIFLRFTNFNSSNNWSNSCQKRRENWLLFWHWLHITVTSYKTNVFTVYATFIKGNIPIKEMDVRDEKKRQKTYFWRSQLDGRKKRSTTTMDFFWQLVLLLFSFFSFSLKISQTLSPSFSWWKSMSWSHDRKVDLENKEDILLAKVKISLNGLNVCCVLILCTLK